MPLHLRFAVLGAVALMPGCGGADPPPAPPPALPASAVSYLPSTQRPLTAAELGREVQRPALTEALGRWGFEAASERSFQGESHRLSVVVSRTLDFDSQRGARAFVAYVHSHPGTFLGAYPIVRPFAAGRRSGWMFRAQGCACHGATALWLGVTSAGRRVTWLEINGPDATARTLAALEARAP